jgi:hypothetical protein
MVDIAISSIPSILISPLAMAFPSIVPGSTAFDKRSQRTKSASGVAKRQCLAALVQCEIGA